MTKLNFHISTENKNACGIYSIKSLIDNRSYVGSTVNFYRRWKEYNYKLQNRHSHNPHLLNFVEKYGIENLEFTSLEICSEKDLETREMFWMIKMDSINSGFNIRKDAISNRGLKHTKETKEKMRASNIRSNLGKNLPSDQKKNITKGLKSFWQSKDAAYREEHGRKSVVNRKTTKSTKNLLSTKLKSFYSENAHPTCKTVLQIELTTGRELNEYPSITAASKKTGADASGISNTIKGKQKSAGGFYWRLKQ